jgi:hypothetical protein
MCQGWVYVLVNSSIPGAAKVGRTTRPPPQRAAELSNATGVATKFIVAYDQEFANCEQAERDIHAELDRRGCRLARNREFFAGPTREIIQVVMQVAASCGEGPPPTPSPSAARWLARGDAHLFGEGDSLQDLAEANRCYRLAAARGSLMALERIGAVWSHIKKKGRNGRRQALAVLQDGARRGNYYCYIEMATLYGIEHHARNQAKSWNLFFARRADSFLQDVEICPDRYILALRRYMLACLEHGMALKHLAHLRAEAPAIIQSLRRSIDEVRDSPGARTRLALVLRWARDNLIPPAGIDMKRPNPPTPRRSGAPHPVRAPV